MSYTCITRGSSRLVKTIFLKANTTQECRVELSKDVENKSNESLCVYIREGVRCDVRRTIWRKEDKKSRNSLLKRFIFASSHTFVGNHNSSTRTNWNKKLDGWRISHFSQKSIRYFYCSSITDNWQSFRVFYMNFLIVNVFSQ